MAHFATVHRAVPEGQSPDDWVTLIQVAEILGLRHTQAIGLWMRDGLPRWDLTGVDGEPRWRRWEIEALAEIRHLPTA